MIIHIQNVIFYSKFIVMQNVLYNIFTWKQVSEKNIATELVGAIGELTVHLADISLHPFSEHCFINRLTNKYV